MDLSALTFGAPAAERDIAIGLGDYFVESEAFGRLSQRMKTVLIGNRGSGKSAIFKILADRARRDGALVLELSPEDYSYEMLCSVLAGEAQGAWAKQGAFASAWKFLIYVLAMKEMSSGGTGMKTGAAKKLYDYLRDNHKGFQDNPIALLISHLKRLEGIKLGKYEAAARTRELDQLYRLEELKPLLPYLFELAAKRRIVVLVDELDKGWDGSEDAKAFVSGLFQAAVSLNENTENFTVYVSLRQELYDSIPALYEDAQKYRDIIETIRWDEPTLLAVIANRIRHSLPQLSDNSDIEAWNAIFAENLSYRKAKSINYMIDRTLFRPRELIQFCTDALQVARDLKIAPIDYHALSRAELIYSDAREKDIAGEYRFQYPGLQSVFEVFRGRSYEMEREDLEVLCLQVNSGDLKTDKSAQWLVDQDPEFLIETLWRVGFLRAYAVGGLRALRRSGSSYVGPHQVAALNLQTISRFQVHPMFRASLGMKEPKRDSEDDASTDGDAVSPRRLVDDRQ